MISLSWIYIIAIFSRSFTSDLPHLENWYEYAVIMASFVAFTFFPNLLATPLFRYPIWIKFFPGPVSRGWHGSNSFRWRGANHGSEARCLIGAHKLSSSLHATWDELCTGIQIHLPVLRMCCQEPGGIRTAWPAPSSAVRSRSLDVSTLSEWSTPWGGFKLVGKRCGSSLQWHSDAVESHFAPEACSARRYLRCLYFEKLAWCLLWHLSTTTLDNFWKEKWRSLMVLHFLQIFFQQIKMMANCQTKLNISGLCRICINEKFGSNSAKSTGGAKKNEESI